MRIFFHNRYKPKNKEELEELINDSSINLWEIDTSLITNMRGLFLDSKRKGKDFEGIETWDVSNVTDMSYMFYNCKNFNRPLNNWNVSKLENAINMFYNCPHFNQPLDKWDVKNLRYMSNMFHGCKKFNQDLNNWDVSNARIVSYMFHYSGMTKNRIKTWKPINADGTTAYFNS